MAYIGIAKGRPVLRLQEKRFLWMHALCEYLIQILGSALNSVIRCIDVQKIVTSIPKQA